MCVNNGIIGEMPEFDLTQPALFINDKSQAFAAALLADLHDLVAAFELGFRDAGTKSSRYSN